MWPLQGLPRTAELRTRGRPATSPPNPCRNWFWLLRLLAGLGYWLQTLRESVSAALSPGLCGPPSGKHQGAHTNKKKQINELTQSPLWVHHSQLPRAMLLQATFPQVTLPWSHSHKPCFHRPGSHGFSSCTLGSCRLPSEALAGVQAGLHTTCGTLWKDLPLPSLRCLPEAPHLLFTAP
jgi:hypothetical protein